MDKAILFMIAGLALCKFDICHQRYFIPKNHIRCIRRETKIEAIKCTTHFKCCHLGFALWIFGITCIDSLQCDFLCDTMEGEITYNGIFVFTTFLKAFAFEVEFWILLCVKKISGNKMVVTAGVAGVNALDIA